VSFSLASTYDGSVGSGASIDRETEALRTIARRAAGLRIAVGLALLGCGVPVGLVGYGAVDQLLFVGGGMHAIGTLPALVDGALGFAPPVLFSLWVGRLLGRALVRARIPRWVVETAGRYGLPVEPLRDAADLY
jgi:hypothetical protein